MTPFTIWKASQVQAGAIAELYLQCRKAAEPTIPPMVHSDEETRSWVADVVCQDLDVWVAAGGSLVGLLVLDGTELDQLYVAPGWQGSGVGTALVELAKQKSPSGLELWTFVSNTGAQRFYERHGFVEIGRTDGDNEEGAPDIRYRWRQV